MDWDGFLDANLEAAFVAGDGTKGDGIFNEMRGFFDAMPDMSREMAKQMGMEGNAKYINRICRSLYEKNLPQIKNMIQKRKFNNDKRASYYNVASMILGFADVQQLTETAAPLETQKRFKDYKIKMDQINVEAKKIADTKGFPASMEFRTRMWKRFEDIVEGAVVTEGLTLSQIDKGEYDGSSDSSTTAVKEVTMQTLNETESVLRNTHHKQRQRRPSGRPEGSLLQGGQ